LVITYLRDNESSTFVKNNNGSIERYFYVETNHKDLFYEIQIKRTNSIYKDAYNIYFTFFIFFLFSDTANCPPL